MTISVNREDYSGVVAVLQAGGRGQRLRPLTDRQPKPMIEVGGVPMVERLLRQFVAAGVRDVVVVTGWQGDQIQQHLARLAGLPADLRIRFHEEETPLGNAGALIRLEGLKNIALFAFADIVTSLSISKLLHRHAMSGNTITLASHEENYRLALGELVIDGEQVVAYREKPEKSFTICSGIAAFSSQFLADCSLDPPVGLVDIVTAALARDLRVAHWPHGAWWIDVNTTEALQIAESEIRGHPL